MTGGRGGRGHKKGEDPEGGERSAWKGFVGPSGLGLEHGRIPDIEKQVYATLLPLVFRAEHPIPLSQFTQAACDVLLPVLPSSQELTDHAFKSQWGRLNEFVCPKLAELRGLGDCRFDRSEKTVQLSIASDPPPGFTPRQVAAVSGGSVDEGAAGGGRTGRRRAGRSGRGRGGGSEGLDGAGAGGEGGEGSTALHEGYIATQGAASTAPAAAAASGAMPVPVALPVAGAQGQDLQYRALPLPAQAAPCLYCGAGYHVIKQCPDFHVMLQSIYQAGYQQGIAAAQQAQQYQPPQVVPAPSHAQLALQQAQQGLPAHQHATAYS